MDEPLADFSAQGVSSRSCVCHSTHGTTGCEHSCACRKDEGFEPEIACGQDEYAAEEVRTVLAEAMHLYDDGGADLDEGSDEDDDAPLSLESDSTYADADVVISPSCPVGGSSESSIDKSDDGNSSANGTPPLISAMKGTRAKQGIIKKLSVSWAPDVYDPPVTSDSHTVRGHQRSSRKSHHRYKPSKGSSSSNRSANSSKKDKKHSRHSSSSSSNRKDKKHSYRSSSCSSSLPQYSKAYNTSSDGSSRTDSHGIESAKAYPLVQPERAAVPQAVPVPKAKAYRFVKPESAAMPEAIPVLKTIEQIKCATSCKEKPFNLLSRQFSPARYKGMFSFWSQNQLAS